MDGRNFVSSAILKFVLIPSQGHCHIPWKIYTPLKKKNKKEMLTMTTFMPISRSINCQAHQLAKACLNLDIEVSLRNHDAIIFSSDE